MHNSPGHSTSKHDELSFGSPTHGRPLCAGAGLSHFRRLVLVPFEHVTEQGCHWLHVDQPPSTGQGTSAQTRQSTSRPEHGWPPYRGSAHSRVRLCLPPAHVTEHRDHSPQADHTPCTEMVKCTRVGLAGACFVFVF